MRIKSISYSYEYKKLRDFKEGDYVLSADGEKAAVLGIQKNGERDVYEIKLSDGRSFRTSETHVSTVHFRNSPTRPGKKVYDVLTTKYIKDHLGKYNFEILTDDTFKLRDMDFIQHLEALPVHEYEPADPEFIIPDEKHPEKVYIESIEKVGSGECWCLNLNDPMGLYVTEKGIITHNSLLTNLCMSYIITLFGLMREPHKILGHSAMTSYCVSLCSATLNKAWDLLGVPFEQFIEQSPFFEKVGRHDDIVNINKEDQECKKCYYTTAARGSAKMVFRNNLQLKMMSTEGALLGNTIVYTAMTELAWWEQMGWTREDIFRFFSKAKQRVDSRMNGHYLGRYVIDSSPFSMESPIDKWIWETAINDPAWYCVLGAKWDYFKGEFPEFFDKDGNEIHNWDVAFQCYKGGKSEPPKGCFTPEEAQTYDPLDMIWCPRKDAKNGSILLMTDLAKQNPVEFLRDWAGIPAGSSDRIFQSGKVLEDIFDNDLKNLYTSLVADAAEEPEHLIWNQIKDKFFINFNGKYLFYREPNAKRILAIDQSTTGDATGISCCHWEYIRDPQTMDIKNVCVVDFSLCIIPKGGRINLEAIRSLVEDLINIGGLNIGLVNFDTFQSESTKQTLIRKGITVDYVSVDKNNEPYTILIDYIMHNRFFAGKNIFLRNNLHSIHWTKRDSGTMKCDHFKGKIINESNDTNWETSQLGTNAKDLADTCAACIFFLTKFNVEYAPTSEWRSHTNSSREVSMERLNKMGFTF